MTYTTYAIGVPGEAPRMLMTATEDQISIQLLENEVYFAIYNSPAPPHKINEAGTALESAVDLAYLRLKAWRNVKAYRDLVVQSGCVTDMGPIDTDMNSRINLQDAVRAPDSQTWTMHDGSRSAITAEQMVAMAETVSLFVQQCYANAFSQKDDIYSSSDPGSIDITAGYPSNACYPGV